MLFLDSFPVSCQSRAMTLDIKICGLKTDAAMAAALAGGASHVGFIFFAKSPRYVEPAEAGRLREAARGKAKAVAVTVDAGDAFLDQIVAKMQPDMLQLHGSETTGRVAELKARYGLPVMKALSVSEAADLDRMKSFVEVADRFLLDSKPPKGSQLPGGNGVAFDWRVLAGLDAGVDYMLSGGLNAANIGDALRQANPPGIDISSGVESAPGVKDPALIEQFFRAARAARDDRAA
ncbi:N-(5'-phosphoribosyl)anthranilate isomerase [Mesorhizobium sp. SOD10]|nr:N-(5'-phosphoribosyl)anthranilate isomerase [Mesorhizobium sp. SOD10]